ncbi:PAQR family membrane homeostasis protein TrhA [Membranihabitans maritimus]|uniref:PAQR family membrane homeostasis protein TrhA n=1 Tax=Membranihabitans maritimus TaxID=2904244 RepID=UPI001F006577|nr:hemolysin III family protein [Membranihabitans maritimus]
MNRIQTQKEERINTITHGVPFLFFVLLIPFLFFSKLSDDFPKFWPILPFLFGIIFTYISSTTYHATRNPKRKEIFKILDHISIFFLIGGTYTPVITNYVSHPTATIFLISMWGLIALGAIAKIWFTGRFDNLSTGFYAFLGWMLIFVIVPIFKNTPINILLLLVAGGLSYTLGIYFYKKDHQPYFHSIWHIFVTAGTINHFIAIFLMY